MSTHDRGATVRSANDLRALSDAHDELDELRVCLKALADLAVPDPTFGPSRNDLATLLGHFAARERAVLDQLGTAIHLNSTCRCAAAEEIGK